MIKEILNDVTRYFDLLIEEGYYVAFHNLSIPLENYMGVLTPYNINSNPYCILVKSSQEAWTHCIERQGKVIKACNNGPFCGICYAGMGEYVYPILGKSNEPIAFISVSGYRMKEDTIVSRISYTAEKYHLDRQKLKKLYQTSLREIPSDEKTLTIKIMPLCRMFELINRVLVEMHVDGIENLERSSILSHAVIFLRRNYACSITVEDVARACYCSASTLSHMFKKELGVSIREYIQNLRMKEAIRMLQNTDLPVNTISDILGYREPNYFSTVFFKKMGCSPTTFRKKMADHNLNNLDELCLENKEKG